MNLDMYKQYLYKNKWGQAMRIPAPLLVPACVRANVPAILTLVRSNAYLSVCLYGVSTYVPGCLTASYTWTGNHTPSDAGREAG